MGLKVVVTGASSDIGRAALLRFCKDGHEVFATAQSTTKLSEIVKFAQDSDSKVYKGVGDVGVEADVERNYAEAIESLGEIDVLVLNAGIGYVAPLEESTTQDFDEVFRTNVRGVFLWLKAALPAFKKRGRGQIVIINSSAGESVHDSNLTVYSASQFALKGLTQALRLELQGFGVKVASIFPAIFDTDLFGEPFWKKVVDPRGFFDVGKTATQVPSEAIVEAIAKIVYQSPKSDIEKLDVFPAQTSKVPRANYGGVKFL